LVVRSNSNMSTVARRSTVPIAHDHGGTRRGGLRSKTPSVNEHSKKLSGAYCTKFCLFMTCDLCIENTPKGKRRLEFVEQPLKDKKFYLDLEGYKKVSSLAARIQDLGGKVEEFLSKDINYLITNRKDVDTRLSPRSNSTPSPGLSIPSPFPATGTRSSSLKGAWPLSGDSPQSIETHQPAPKHDTRAQAIMKQAQATLTNRYGTSNILTNARTWGVYVIYLDKVLEKLAEFGPSQAEKQPSIKELMVYGKKQLRVKIRKLQVPFIKVEDQSRQYRPLVKEFKEWPLPDFDSPVGTCPFDTPRERRDQEPKKRIKDKYQQKDAKKQQAKKGYCECCCLHYNSLDVHLKSEHHQSFARKDANYESIDQLISQGPSLKVFLEKDETQVHHDESRNPFQTPSKDDDIDILDGKDETTPDNNAKKMNKKGGKCIQDKDRTLSEESYPENDNHISTIPLKTKEAAHKTTTLNTLEDFETRRMTRSRSSPSSVKLNEITALLDEEMIKEIPMEKNKAVAKVQEQDVQKSDPQQEFQQTQHASSGADTAEGREKHTRNDAQPQVMENRDEEATKHVENDTAKDSASGEEPTFTRLRSSRKPFHDDVEQSKTKRVLRSNSKSCSSDSTEALSNQQVVNPSSPRKRRDTDHFSSSTISLLEKSTKSDLDDSPRKPSIRPDSNVRKTRSKVDKTSPEIDCDKSNDYEDKRPVISRSIPPQFSSSPRSGFAVNRVDDNLSDGEEKNCSMRAEAGSCPSTPKASKCRKKSQGKRNKEGASGHPTNEEVQGSNANTQNDLEKEREKSAKELEETYTTLFDSDDDEPFEGFEIPHFEGSSDPDLMYRVKEIVNYYISSQESTLVESGDEERSGHTEDTAGTETKKKKRSPHGIKVILSSRTDESDDDVFEDKNDDDDVSFVVEDDDDYDTSSTVADSTDGNEDEHLLSSPLRMDTLYSKRKSWNLDDMEDNKPTKRRRTTSGGEYNDEDVLQTSMDYLKDELPSTSQSSCSDFHHSTATSTDRKEETENIDIQKRPNTRSRTTRNKQPLDKQNCGTDAVDTQSTRRVTRSQDVKTTVSLKRLETNEWKVVCDNDQRKPSTKKPKNNNNTIEASSSSRTNEHTDTENRTSEVSKSESSSSSSSVERDESCRDASIANEIPQEFLEPSVVLMSIEERVKLRQLEKWAQRQSECTVKNESDLTQTKAVQERDESQSNEKVEKKKIRSASVTQAKKLSSVSRRSSRNDSTSSTDMSTKLRSRSHPKPNDIFTSTADNVNSTPFQKKSVKVFSPTNNRNQAQNAAWIFNRDKFTASTPQSSRKTRSTKTVESLEGGAPTTRKLRNTSRCLIAGDSYEFMDEDAYAFD
ncbi:hypothetical protein QZH41_015511, partial [Actinostola sp. cb2023]